MKIKARWTMIGEDKSQVLRNTVTWYVLMRGSGGGGGVRSKPDGLWLGKINHRSSEIPLPGTC